MTVLIGTSGYSYKDWLGVVYPPDTAAKDYLVAYEKIFSFTELNFSYYRQPDPRTIEQMVHKTQDDFIFSIKAHRSITHEITDSYENDVKLFKEGVRPLIQAGKLGAILIQFPHSFHYTADSRKHLLAVCKSFENLPVAIEFRNDEWQKESVYNGMKDYNIAFVNVDEPDLEKLPKPSAIVTSHFAYIRFHGRNDANWWKGDNASRYDYLYNENELSEWIPKITKIAEKSTRVIIAFNNHWKGQAVTNAKAMKNLLQ